jgi:2-amino-4-hydroxy-6-hydroxymethyldihydropteridine diphosphokinase
MSESGADARAESGARRAAIALGSNLGERAHNLQQAIEQIRTLGRILAVSRFHDTAPVGYLDQPRFLNGAVLIETEVAPVELMQRLLAIECSLGRDRGVVPAKGPRVIDLDLIFCGELVMRTPELTLPHPAMHERGFVLEPLAEIAPGWVHPIVGKTVAEMLAVLPDWLPARGAVTS